jgi:hypothetical protein
VRVRACFGGFYFWGRRFGRSLGVGVRDLVISGEG